MKSTLKKILSILSIALLSTQIVAAKYPKKHKFTLVNKLSESVNCTVQFSGLQCSSMKFNPARFKLKPNQAKTVFVPHGCKVTGITALNQFATGPISSSTYPVNKNITLFITNDRGITQKSPRKK